MELPHVQKIFADAKSQGLEVVALNLGDEAKVITDYWKQEKFTFSAVQAERSVHERFGVVAYPTNYVVDGNGKVLARMVGYDEARLKGALRKAGIQVN